MLPTLVIVGRPNVGKSTLFNRLTKTRAALVADLPGLTRDRHYGRGRVGDRPFLVVDTGGFEPVAKDGIMHEMAKQTRQAIADADEPALTDDHADAMAPIKVAIVGRPNVGKSTLVNTLVGEERVIAFDQPGTTRDSIYLDFERGGRRYTLIDTAGIRRRGKVIEAVEKFSVIKSLQAIEDANVVVLLLDAEQDVTEQDAHLAGYILDTGRALVVAVNKWDGLTPSRREDVKREFERKLGFLA